MSLEEYAGKRDFSASPEPEPGKKEVFPSSHEGKRFVIHKHDASHIHYDLRLEFGGALVSWAVPKGLATPHDPRKLAVHVEDHPLEYLDFKGRIPEGQYGAGTMAIWDRGEYEALDDFAAGLESGKLTFRLRGKRVDGEFSLVRMKGKEAGDDKNWLVILHDADSLNPGLKTVGEAAPMPTTPQPMLAVLTDAPFDSPEYTFEIKFDGMRALTRLDASGAVSILSRNQKEQARRFPELVDIAANLLAGEIVVDGEIAAVDERGVSRFQLLQKRLNLTGEAAVREAAKRRPVYYYVFDLIYLDGRDVTMLPLSRRRELLEQVTIPHKQVRLSELFEAKGKALFSAARENGLEGIIAKRRESPYRSKRSRDWLKVKVVQEQEFVIGGFTAPSGSRTHFGALLLGLYEGDDLLYCGSVGTGFSREELARLRQAMEPLIREESPFRTAPSGDGVIWVRPELVAQVKFAEWTREGSLRQPVYLGLRDDVPPRECVREKQGEAPSPDTAAARAGAARTQPLPPLAATVDDRRVTIDGREVALSNLGKPFWPRQGFRKFDLVNYYYRVAPSIVPHLAGRPMTLKRYPDGFGSEPFFQKEAPPETPEWVRKIDIASTGRGRDTEYIICDDVPTLLFLANIACISQNPWLSRADNLDSPDFIVFDLDPDSDDAFPQCIEAAVMVRDQLARFGLRGYPKTSGASGIHVYVPLKAGYSYEQVRQFARVIGTLCRSERPQLVTIEPTIARRDAPVYLDILQNAWGQTVASVYSVRAREGAPVSAPLVWEEVAPGLTPSRFTIANMIERLDEKGDLFAPVLDDPQDLLLAIQAGEKFIGRRRP